MNYPVASVLSLASSGDSLPRRFGRYVLFSKIGEGGMARLYLAKGRTELGGERRLVVKQILPLFANSPAFASMLIDEAKLSATLSHGNIVQVFDLGREEDTLYIAMEYVEGFDLRMLLRQCTRKRIGLPSEFTLYIVHEVLVALDYAHNKRSETGASLEIVHRDVSPSNVLLSLEGEVKLCDFGIARALGMGQALPEEVVQGKAGYMSPETASHGVVDPRSDVFSVGIVLWELIAGRRLYKTAGKPASLETAMAAEIPPLPKRGWPEEEALHGIVYRALEKNPEDRYASAQAMLDDLDEYLHKSRLFVSPLRFGRWLHDKFGEEIIEHRNAEETEADRLREGSDISDISRVRGEESPPIDGDADTHVGPLGSHVRSSDDEVPRSAGSFTDEATASKAGSSASDVGDPTVAEPLSDAVGVDTAENDPAGRRQSRGFGIWIWLVLALLIGAALYLTRQLL